MFAQCADPKALEGLSWLMCYLTSGKHLLFYASFGTVLLLLAVTGMFVLKGKKGLTGRGKWFVLAGLAVPVAFLIVLRYLP